MAKQLLGKPVVEAIKKVLAEEVVRRRLNQEPIGFATVRVGEDPASVVYQGRLMKSAADLGLEPVEVNLSEASTEDEVIQILKELGARKEIAGILLFMPLPKSLNSDRIISEIPIHKDVDCLNPYNFSQVMAGKSPWGPCTPRAVIAMLDFYEYDLKGKNVVVVGRSNVVGRPLSQMLLNRDATVTICHSKTQDLAFHTKQADLVVMAVGQEGLLKGEMLKPGAWVVDVGINMRKDGQGITGDADFDSCEPVCEAISPVPGGVGTISVTMVMQALLRGDK